MGFIRALRHWLAAALLAVAALVPLVAAAAASHQVSVSFSPRTITLGQTAILEVVIKQPGGGGTGLSFTLSLPSGLTTSGFTVGSDCSASGTSPSVSSTSTSLSMSDLDLRPGGTCTVAITVLASAAGTYAYPANALNVNSNGGSNSNAAGTSLIVNPSPDPTAELSATSLAFSSQLVGTTSTAQAVTLSNNGGSALSLSAVSVSGDFNVTGCAAPATIASGSSCTFSVTFKPTATGARTGALQLTTSAGARTVSLSGTGTAPTALLSPASANLGSVHVGSSASAVVTLTNTGSAALSIGSIAVSGSPFSQANACPASLAPGLACSIAVSYAPQSTGTHAGTLTVASNASNGTVTTSLSGTATPAPAPAMGLSAASLAFGSLLVNSASSPQSLTISNTGNADLSVRSIAVAGDFTASGCAAPLTLAAGASCTLSVTFKPTATGTRSGSIAVDSNASGSPHAVALSGSGTAPGVSLTPSSVSFSAIAVGASATSTVTLANTGTGPLTVASVTASGSAFSQSNTCPGTLQAGASCGITVTYSPATAGNHEGQLAIATNAQSAPYVVVLAGSAFATAPKVSLSRTEVDFGSQTAGTSSTAQTVVLGNTGNAALSIQFIAASGDFAVSGCAAGSSVAPGASCTLSIVFTPTSTGARAGGVTITTNAAGSPHTIALAGAGTAPGVWLSPSPLTFAAISVGSRATSAVTLTNTGDAPLAVQGIAIAGSFLSQAHNCPASLAAAASCAIQVTYAPMSAGSHTGQLSVSTNAQSAPYVVAISATASAPALTLSRASISFGTQLLGTRSAAETVSVSNTGSAPLTIRSVGATGDFSVGGCPAATVVPPGASCTLSISFQPTATGARSGTVQIASDAPGSPHTIALSGTGMAEAGIALAPSTVSFGSISAGAISVLRVVVTNTGLAPLAIALISAAGSGFTQTNTCPASLGAGASCDAWVTFAPASPGAYAGQLTVVSNAGSGSAVATLQGNATPADAPRLELSRSSVDFGAQTVGSASAAQSVTVKNAGSAPLSITSIVATGDYNFTGCATPLTLQAGDSCLLSVVFQPTAAGARSGSIAISSNAPEGAGSIALQGSGTPAPVPNLVATPAAVSFGSVVAGQRATARVALANTGTAPLAISSIGIAGGGPFAQTNDCPASLAPNAACEVTLAYAPTIAGTHTSQLVVSSNAGSGTLAVAITGNATPVLVADVRLSRTSVVFGSQFVGTTSAPQTVTLSNAGTATVRILSIATSGDFGYTGCGYPATLAPGESCDFAITFRPLRTGPASGGIEIASDAPSSPHRVSLAGDGASTAMPQIEMRPFAVAFGAVRVGADALQQVRLRNSGGTTLLIDRIFLTGAFFSQTNDCPSMLAVGAGCDIAIAYAPLAEGAHGAQLRIESNAVPNPHVLPLSGNGIVVPPPFMTVQRALDFGTQVVGSTGRRTLEIANSGADPLVITGLRLLGADAFAVEGACPSIAPAQRCSLAIAFTPRVVGELAARLDIVSNHVGGVVSIELGGAGIPQPQPSLQLSIDGVGYGNQTVGTSSEPRTIRLTSSGNVPVRLTGFEVSYDFAVDAASCPASLEPGKSCEVSVTFKPIVPGPRTGRLTISSDAAGAPHSVSLIGIGCRFFSMSALRNPDRLCAP